MNRVVEVRRKKEKYRHGPFRIEEVRLRHTLRDGSMSGEVTRVSFERGDSAAAIVYDPTAETVVLTQQFRYSSYAAGFGWILELPAGSIDPSARETPEETMRRELLEEVGYRVAELKPVSTFFVSPGATSERIFLYYAQVSAQDHVAAGGGLKASQEDIEVITMPLREALRRVQTGEIADAKTIIGLQWLQLQQAAQQSAQAPAQST